MKKEFPSQEYEKLSHLKKYLNFTPNGQYECSIGDDAAIRRCTPNEQLIFTADTLVEGVHFSLDLMSLKEVGFKSMVANVSDCAAMGAFPDSALVQLTFPEKSSFSSISALYEGFHEACKMWDFQIVGGDLTKGPCWIVSITFIGRKDKKSPLLTRGGLQVGDSIWATGIPGKSAAGFDLLQYYGRENIPSQYKGLTEAHIRPIAQIDIGLQLSHDKSVHTMIDLSDGVAKECRTLSYDNNCSIQLYPETFWHHDFSSLERKFKHDTFHYSLYGGEDYQLLFGASQEFEPSRYTNQEFHKIGDVIDSDDGVFYYDIYNKKVTVGSNGWDHFQ